MTDDELKLRLMFLGRQVAKQNFILANGDGSAQIHPHQLLNTDNGRFILYNDYERRSFATAEELLDAVVEYLRSKQCNSTQATSQL